MVTSRTVCLGGVLFLGACTSSQLAPVFQLTADLNAQNQQASLQHDRQKKSPNYGVQTGNSGPLKKQKHLVQPGETLFAIAWRYSYDHRMLAKLNGVTPPYTIYPGQTIWLSEPLIENRQRSIAYNRVANKPNNSANSGALTTPSNKGGPIEPVKATQSYKKPKNNKKVVQGTDSFTASKAVQLKWRWPASGAVVKKFSTTGVGNKGIKIAGSKGEAVFAAASGKVVYSGAGVVGYDNLIIIQHSELYLSAYAHNSRLIAKEGMQIKVGEKIAEIGSSGTDKNQLHFEIRRAGKPQNPLKFLPPKT